LATGRAPIFFDALALDLMPHLRRPPVLGTAVGVLVLLGCSEGSRRVVRPTSFAFDSRYEVRRAESLVTEDILKREMDVEAEHEGEEGEAQPTFESKTLIKSERCMVSPPPPAATRLLCRVLVSVEERAQTSKASHVNGWAAVVTLSPRSGKLGVRLQQLNGEA
jgi:hypothetical protein